MFVHRLLVLASSLVLASPAVAIPAKPSRYASTLPAEARSMFTESMDFMDYYYDQPYGYLYEVTGAMALRHETRSSVWYAIGFLARNEGKDGSEAEKIIRNVIGAVLHMEPLAGIPIGAALLELHSFSVSRSLAINFHQV